MWKDRIRIGVSLFGLAGVCGLLAWHEEGLGIGLLGGLALWFGAAAFAWKGSQALLGRIGVPEEGRPDPPADPPLIPGRPGTTTLGAHEDAVGQATRQVVGDTLLRVRRAWVVLALIVLVPCMLGFSAWGIVMLSKKDFLSAGIMLGVACFLGWYCYGPLRRAWQGNGAFFLGGGGDA